MMTAFGFRRANLRQKIIRKTKAASANSEKIISAAGLSIPMCQFYAEQLPIAITLERENQYQMAIDGLGKIELDVH